MSAFSVQKLVRFHHCDPAGIVFYPQYFMIFNEVVEDWFAAALGVDFRQMHLVDHEGMPVRKTECEFFAPSKLGDVLDCALTVDRVGNSSVAITITVGCKGELRTVVHHVLVHVSNTTGAALPIADMAFGRHAIAVGSLYSRQRRIVGRDDDLVIGAVNDDELTGLNRGDSVVQADDVPLLGIGILRNVL